MSINDQIADKTIERNLLLLRYGAKAGKDVTKILAALEKDILRQIPDIVSETRKARVDKLLKEVRTLIAASYGDIEALALQESAKLAELESNWQATAINTAVGVDIVTALPTPAQIDAIASDVLINGAPQKDWWSRQSVGMQNRFMDVMRIGMSQSETNAQIAKRVSDALGIGRKDAFVLAKTSAQAVAMQARQAVYSANDNVVAGKMSLATLDSHTSLVCATYDHAQYNNDNEPINGTTLPYKSIPRHFGCRSTWTVVLKSLKEMGLPFDDFKPSTRASMDGQISAGTTFEKFLSSKSSEWQDKYLGKGRAELYRKGKITLSDLIDGTGREIPLSEL